MLKIALVSSLAFLCGVSFTTRVSADDLLPSHAYLYTQSSPFVKKGTLEVVIQQLNTVSFMGCNYTATNPLPSTPDALVSFLSSFCGTYTLGPINHQAGYSGALQLFYQTLGGRYILSIVEMAWAPATNPPAIAAGSSVEVFDPQDPDTINVQYLGTWTQPQKNPVAETEDYSWIRSYDADIQYPVITEQPIQQ